MLSNLILALFLSFSCSGPKAIAGTAGSPDHQTWDQLLQSHVNDEGWVDYKGMIQDSSKLNQYLNDLESHPPGKKWSDNERMTYWINAYNAYTVQLIIRNYPVKTIKEIGGSLYKINTSWDLKFIKIAGEKLDLNNIEHKKLRKQFDDPRIHFAIVCASYSCPRLLNRAFTAEKLDQQLDFLAKDFLMDQRKNQVSADKLQLSKIFNWYKGDFTGKKHKNIISYIQQYTEVKIDPEAEIVWNDYKWDLNEQK